MGNLVSREYCGRRLIYGCLILVSGCAENKSNIPIQTVPPAPIPSASQPSTSPATPALNAGQSPDPLIVPPSADHPRNSQPVTTGSNPPAMVDGGDGPDMPVVDTAGQVQTYLIQPGDSLFKIAKCFGTTVESIKEINPSVKERPNLIYPNEKLLLPGKLRNRCALAVDVCLNIPGHQASVPNGMIIDAHGNCVQSIAPIDMCPNIPGSQPVVPDNMHRDSSGNCALAQPRTQLPVPPSPPQTRPQTQAVPPPPQLPIDVCPNISGPQRIVPPGMIKDPTGSCVAIYVPCETFFRRDFPGGKRKVLLSSGSASNLLTKYLREAEARKIDVNLETLVVTMYVRAGEKMDLINIPAPKLSVWQNATGKHEREWQRLLQDKHAERLPSPVDVADQLRADVVCGE